MVGRVTPCAPFAMVSSQNSLIFRQCGGAHGVTRPTFSALDDLGNTPLPRLLQSHWGRDLYPIQFPVFAAEGCIASTKVPPDQAAEKREDDAPEDAATLGLGPSDIGDRKHQLQSQFKEFAHSDSTLPPWLALELL